MRAGADSRRKGCVDSSTGLAFRSGAAERYRAWLAQDFGVAALIGLPSGVLSVTNLPALVLILESKRPSATFVAHLEADWQEQLSADGTAMRPCRCISAPLMRMIRECRESLSDRVARAWEELESNCVGRPSTGDYVGR